MDGFTFFTTLATVEAALVKRCDELVEQPLDRSIVAQYGIAVRLCRELSTALKATQEHDRRLQASLEAFRSATSTAANNAVTAAAAVNAEPDHSACETEARSLREQLAAVQNELKVVKETRIQQADIDEAVDKAIARRLPAGPSTASSGERRPALTPRSHKRNSTAAFGSDLEDGRSLSRSSPAGEEQSPSTRPGIRMTLAIARQILDPARVSLIDRDAKTVEKSAKANRNGPVICLYVMCVSRIGLENGCWSDKTAACDRCRKAGRSCVYFMAADRVVLVDPSEEERRRLEELDIDSGNE